MTFKGIITSVSAEQSGTSKTGRAWRKIDVVLTYDNSNPEWPRAIVFSVMNDNIGKFGFRADAEYEVEVDFSTHEYNGRTFMSATCWKATPTEQPAPVQQPVYQQAQASKDDMGGDLPF